MPSYIDLFDDLLLVGKTFKDVLEGKENLLKSCSCIGAASMPSAALRARQLCIAARTAATLASAAAPAATMVLRMTRVTMMMMMTDD